MCLTPIDTFRPDPGADQAWLDEIQRRSREFDAGLVEAIPAGKVFADLRAKLSRG